MPKDPPHPFEEPFGQTGALQLVRPAILFFCALGVIASAFMSLRSNVFHDRMSRTHNGQRIEIGSVIDRFVFTVGPPRTDEEQSGTWTITSGEIRNTRDGWQDSWKKTLGVEWGHETFFWRPPPETYWRLRVKWRTIAIACMVPLAVETFRRRRAARREIAAQPIVDAPPM